MDIEKFLTQEDKDFRESLAISKSNISKAVCNFATITFDINYSIAIIEDSINKSKRKLEKISALKEKAEKTKASIDKIKLSEKDLDRAVKLSSTYDSEYEQYMEYKKVLGILKAKSKALEAKDKMIGNAVYLLSREVKASKTEKTKEN